MVLLLNWEIEISLFGCNTTDSSNYYRLEEILWRDLKYVNAKEELV